MFFVALIVALVNVILAPVVLLLTRWTLKESLGG
jgi:hypothetical protein